MRGRGMSKTNPKNFKPYIDPEGGEWIKVTGKGHKYEGVTWRPVDMNLDGNKFNFQVEFLTIEDAEKYDREDKFQKMASDIIADILNVKKNEAPSIITDI